jgi:hypothetical protein
MRVWFKSKISPKFKSFALSRVSLKSFQALDTTICEPALCRISINFIIEPLGLICCLFFDLALGRDRFVRTPSKSNIKSVFSKFKGIFCISSKNC